MHKPFVVQKISIRFTTSDPNNPRTGFNQKKVDCLGANIRMHGVQVPIIVVPIKDLFLIVDGHYRVKGCEAAGLDEIPAIILSERPSEADLLSMQLSISEHRENLNAADAAEAYERLMTLRGFTPSQLAAHLGLSPASVTRILAILKLEPELRELVRQGKLSSSAAYSLARMEPEQRALYMAKAEAGELRRDDLNKRKNGKPKNSTKQKRVVCPLLHGTFTFVSSNGSLTLDHVIENLENALAEARKARKEELDVTTFAKVMADRAKAKKAS